METALAVNSFLNSRRAQNLSSETIEWYQGRLRKFSQFAQELPVNPEPIEEFLTSLNVSAETKHNYFRVLRAFYRFISQRNGIGNPMTQIAAPRCPKRVMPTLEPHQIMQVIDSATKLRDRVLITLLVDTGARVGEIAGLRKESIGAESITVSGKTGQREIPISEETRQLLLAQVIANSNSKFVFSGRGGWQLSREAIYLRIKTLMKKAGIQGPKLGPHRIRHAFGKSYLVNGGDLRSLQLIMGHANITTTQKYAALNLSNIIAKHHQFTPLRSAHAAAQESFLDTGLAIKQAEEILAQKEANHGQGKTL